MADHRIPFPEGAFPLLRKALERIAAHPEEFYMPSWIVTDDPLEDEDNREAVEHRTGRPFCGTAACLAGHIQLAAGHSARDIMLSFHVGKEALESLGIDRESRAGVRLDDLFDRVEIRDYDGLCDALHDDFTFPDALPLNPFAE